eukprot:1665938-Pyramimonas_sp.AAC.1
MKPRASFFNLLRMRLAARVAALGNLPVWQRACQTRATPWLCQGVARCRSRTESSTVGIGGSTTK